MASAELLELFVQTSERLLIFSFQRLDAYAMADGELLDGCGMLEAFTRTAM